MAITVVVPDLDTSSTEFEKYAKSFGVSMQSDGRGGIAYMATLSVDLKDSLGNVYKQVSYTAELPPNLVTTIRSFIINNILPALKSAEKV